MKNTATIDALLIRETEGRLLVDVGESAPVWLPKHSCTHDAETQTVTMPEVLAIEMGLV